MNAAAAHITRLDGCLEWQFALISRVPCPGFRVRISTIFGEDLVWKAGGRESARRVHISVSHRHHWLKGRLTAEKHIVADTDSTHEPAYTCADHVFAAQLVGNAKTRLKILEVNVRKRLGSATKQIVEFSA